jgi:hypothetical protein
VAYNFQIGSIKVKLLMEYESVIEKVLLLIESMLKIVNNFKMRNFICIVSSLKIICHGNPENNVESLYRFQQVYKDNINIYIINC